MGCFVLKVCIFWCTLTIVFLWTGTIQGCSYILPTTCTLAANITIPPYDPTVQFKIGNLDFWLSIAQFDTNPTVTLQFSFCVVWLYTTLWHRHTQHTQHTHTHSYKHTKNARMICEGWSMWDETSFFVMTNLCCTGERNLIFFLF